jgi:mannose-6-phosphate isomerase class I
MILHLTDKFTYFDLYVCIYIYLYIRERKCSRAIMRLAQQFPDDPGAMAPLFLNYLLIAPGESFFMAGKTLFSCILSGA